MSMMHCGGEVDQFVCGGEVSDAVEMLYCMVGCVPLTVRKNWDTIFNRMFVDFNACHIAVKPTPDEQAVILQEWFKNICHALPKGLHDQASSCLEGCIQVVKYETDKDYYRQSCRLEIERLYELADRLDGRRDRKN